MTNAADWIVARIERGWSEHGAEQFDEENDSYALARFARRKQKLRVYGPALLRVPLTDFAWTGGFDCPPTSRVGISWRHMFLVNVESTRGNFRATPIWVHPDIERVPHAAATLASFVPNSACQGPVMVGLQAFLACAGQSGVSSIDQEYAVSKCA